MGIARGRVSHPKWRLICGQIFRVPTTTGLEVKFDGEKGKVLHVKANNDEEQEANSPRHQLIWGEVNHTTILCTLAAQ